MKRSILVVAALLSLAAPAVAQEYPARTIRVIIPLTPGSGADIAARVIGKAMSEAWSQPIVVENRAGAGGQIGTSAVVNSERDGYTLLVQSASHASNSAIYRSLPYDPSKDLVDVALLGVTPYVMVTAADGPYETLKSLVEAGKANPGAISFASAGVGTSTHLAAEYVIDLAGVKMQHIPYRGSPEAIRDVIAGRVAFYMAPINTALGLVTEGKLRALGVSTKERAGVLPQVPPIAEQGFPDYQTSLWFGMWAPAGTPAAVIAKLNEQVARSVNNAEVREQFAKLGIEPKPMTPTEFSAFVRSEIETYQRVVKQAGIPQQ